MNSDTLAEQELSYQQDDSLFRVQPSYLQTLKSIFAKPEAILHQTRHKPASY